MKTKTYKSITILLVILANLLLSSSIFAQAFDKISYQAVIRDADGNLVTNQTIGMQIRILVGAGTAYQETHTPTTNANGLVSIEIGGGTTVSGMWSMIYWEYGDCSIKTEIDPTGGTNYTITGTSQLLSVPFTIHAKTAITADTAEVAHTAENVIVYTAGAGIDITNSVISVTSISTTYTVGDFAQGGIVFWVDETGEHGLVCAKEDKSTATFWSESNDWIGANGNGPFSGEMNTTIMQSKSTFDVWFPASSYCSSLVITEGNKSYGDWYLPSKGELIIMCQEKQTINATAIANGGSAFANEIYWSSTQGGIVWTAYRVDLSGSSCSSYASDKDEEHNIRAIRAF